MEILGAGSGSSSKSSKSIFLLGLGVGGDGDGLFLFPAVLIDGVGVGFGSGSGFDFLMGLFDVCDIERLGVGVKDSSDFSVFGVFMSSILRLNVVVGCTSRSSSSDSVS